MPGPPPGAAVAAGMNLALVEAALDAVDAGAGATVAAEVVVAAGAVLATDEAAPYQSFTPL